MTEHLQVTFRHMPASEPLEQLIRNQAAKLASRYGAGRCHLVVDGCSMAAGKRGGLAQVTLEVRGQLGQLAATCMHESAYAAVREAFSNMARQMERRSVREAG